MCTGFCEKRALKAVDRNLMNRRVRMIITWTPVNAVASCLLSLLETGIGIMIWLVMPFFSMTMRNGKKDHNHAA